MKTKHPKHLLNQHHDIMQTQRYLNLHNKNDLKPTKLSILKKGSFKRLIYNVKYDLKRTPTSPSPPQKNKLSSPSFNNNPEIKRKRKLILTNLLYSRWLQWSKWNLLNSELAYLRQQDKNNCKMKKSEIVNICKYS